MDRRVTIKDVARIAGVTHTTVSRVIHDDARISDATKKRVRKALAHLDYQPNLVARGLVNNRTQVVALISPELSPFALPVVRSVAESCSKRDYAMMLFPTNTWVRESLSFERVAQNWLVDGILVYNLIYHDKVPKEVLALQSKNLPFVFVNKFLDSKEVNSVGVDNDYAVQLAVEHLAGLGHKRIGNLYGNLTSVDGMERYRAFRSVLGRLGLPWDESITACGYWYEENAREAMGKILDHTNPPTAMFCANDVMAMAAIQVIRGRGLEVPKDIAVAGFDDLEAGRYFPVPLTTIRPPLFEAGNQAFELLMELIQDPTRPPRQIRLKSELIVRASSVRP